MLISLQICFQMGYKEIITEYHILLKSAPKLHSHQVAWSPRPMTYPSLSGPYLRQTQPIPIVMGWHSGRYGTLGPLVVAPLST
jgi:hypothetical protein